MMVTIRPDQTVADACSQALGRPVELYRLTTRETGDRIEVRADDVTVGWFRLTSTEVRPCTIELHLCT